MLFQTMRTIVCGIVAVLLTVSVGCDDKPAPVPTKSPATQSAAQRIKCPLCVNHEIEITDETPTARHEGQTYYFCSKGCQERFLSDPEKFIARAKARGAAATRPAGSN
jgi:YHS domain-containing protein